ncbi:hypothetical protein GGR51DRAFT_548347 [Nemania sp. FL0031]|nr:hypothetical protein GGR51DRAFT_548347 [Nemania sp. FL0031]
MSYPAEKASSEEFQDERSSAEIGLLRKTNMDSYTTTKDWKKRPWILPLLFHTAILATYTLLFLFTFWSLKFDSKCRLPDIIDSSATSAIEYGTRVFDEIDDLDNYFGKPTPELDARWKELLKYQWIQIPESDMKKLGRVEEGIRLPDGGYYATLAVYHDLHCLRRIHHAFHRDHYFPNMTAEERFLDSRHAAHCLDSLRQSVQCAGDVSLLTMRWGVHTREPLANFTSRHESKNAGCTFDRLTKAWLPAQCPRYYEEEYIQFPATLNLTNITGWHYWEDHATTKEITDEEMAFFAETRPVGDMSWVSTNRMHLAHCAFVLMRRADAEEAGERMDATSEYIPHMKHCLQMLLNAAMKAPGIDKPLAEGQVGFGAC